MKMSRPMVSAAMVLGLLANQSRAGVIFTPGNNPQQPAEENVLLNGALSGASILGTTNQSNLNVKFASSTDTLSAPSNGQARVVAADGLINNLSISVPGGFFGDLIINPFKPAGTGSATLTAIANEPASGTSTFTSNLALGNGSITSEFFSSVPIPHP